MTIKRLNLTQHTANEAQKLEGVYEPSESDKKQIKHLITFSQMPSAEEIKDRVENLVKIVESYSAENVMIGGAGFLMSPLEKELRKNAIIPWHAFSVRDSVDLPNGEKKSVFKHLGFVNNA